MKYSEFSAKQALWHGKTFPSLDTRVKSVGFKGQVSSDDIVLRSAWSLRSMTKKKVATGVSFKNGEWVYVAKGRCKIKKSHLHCTYSVTFHDNFKIFRENVQTAFVCEFSGRSLRTQFI